MSNETPGDETGARAERLKEIRFAGYERAHVVDVIDDVRFLHAELDRVTAERDEWRASGLVWRDERDALAEHKGPIHVVMDERDAALASRNAWAQKAVERSHDVKRLREALEHCKHRPHEHNPGPEFTVTHCEVIDRALAAATEEKP